MTSDSRLPTSRRAFLAATGATVGGLALGGSALAQQEGENGPNDDGPNGNGARQYRVTVTNLTSYQPFTPPAVALHQSSVELFSVGDEANEAVQQIAENGNAAPLLELVDSTNAIRGAGVADTALVPASDPGDTDLPYFTEIHVGADASAQHLSLIAMLIATNDGFIGLDTVPLPEDVNESITYFAQGYDAGTEMNTELFADMVPPAQSLTGEDRGIEGTGMSNPDLAEGGVITPHPGIVGDSDDPESVPDFFDWNEPAASVVVERIS